MQYKRMLRIFLAHNVQKQPWKRTAAGESPEPTVNFESGEGVPSWAFRIQRGLSDVSIQLYPYLCLTPLSTAGLHSQAQGSTLPQVRKLNHCLRTLSIEMERDPSLYPESNEHEQIFHHSHRECVEGALTPCPMFVSHPHLHL